jgi:hypothetical protein
MSSPHRLAGPLLALLLLWSIPARGIVLEEDEFAERSTELALLLRTFALAFAGKALEPPRAPLDASPSGSGIFDLRLTLSHQRGALKAVIAGQLTSLAHSHGPSSAALGLGRGAEPPRWLPLQDSQTGGDGYELRYALDWLYLSYALGPLTLTIGRQPLTFGRGTLFKPSDIISTFALTEIDTEFKPGADALRLDWNVAARSVLTIVAAPGELADDLDAEVELRGTSLVARFKQAFDRGEVGALAGLVRRDVVLGVDGIFDLHALDLYSEVLLHLFTEGSLTPNDRTWGGLGGSGSLKRAALRALVGARFKPASTLTVSPELFFNGLGAWDKEDYLAVATSERFAIGELYNMGQLYLGGFADWEAHPLVHLTLATMINARDPSTLVSLGCSYSAASNVELLGGLYLPLGELAAEGKNPLLPDPRSEYGLYPFFFFAEIKVAI